MDYEIKKGVLIVNKQLDDDYDVSFDRVCTELVCSSESDVVIDLSRVRFITSTYIGLLAATFFQAKHNGKNMTIAAQGQVLNVLRISGFEGFMPIINSAKAAKKD